MDEISRTENIKIKYLPVSDIETYLIEVSDNDIDLAIIPNPQGVVNLGERNIATPINKAIDQENLNNKFSDHLIEITTSKKDNTNIKISKVKSGDENWILLLYNYYLLKYHLQD